MFDPVATAPGSVFVDPRHCIAAMTSQVTRNWARYCHHGKNLRPRASRRNEPANEKRFAPAALIAGGTPAVPANHLIVFTGPAGFAGSFTGVFSRAITSAMPRSSCGSRPSISDFGSLSTSMSGSTP